MENEECVHYFSLPPDAYKGKIPFIVTELIQELEKRHADDVNGIFRLNGSDMKVKELIKEFDTGIIPNLSLYPNIHDISTTLKRYFRAMIDTDPLIPFEHYEAVITAMGLKDNDQKIETIKSILAKIGKSRLKTLAFVCKYLAKLSLKNETNGMTTSNLGVCVGPVLISTRDRDNFSFCSQSVLGNKAIETMIKESNLLFDNVEITEEDICDEEDIESFAATKINFANAEHMILRCKSRQDSLVPYIPSCRMWKSEIAKRPTRKPPPPVEETQSSESNQKKKDILSLIMSLTEKYRNSESNVTNLTTTSPDTEFEFKEIAKQELEQLTDSNEHAHEINEVGNTEQANDMNQEIEVKNKSEVPNGDNICEQPQIDENIITNEIPADAKIIFNTEDILIDGQENETEKGIFNEIENIEPNTTTVSTTNDDIEGNAKNKNWECETDDNNYTEKIQNNEQYDKTCDNNQTDFNEENIRINSSGIESMDIEEYENDNQVQEDGNPGCKEQINSKKDIETNNTEENISQVQQNNSEDKESLAEIEPDEINDHSYEKIIHSEPAENDCYDEQNQGTGEEEKIASNDVDQPIEEI